MLDKIPQSKPGKDSKADLGKDTKKKLIQACYDSHTKVENQPCKPFTALDIANTGLVDANNLVNVENAKKNSAIENPVSKLISPKLLDKYTAIDLESSSRAELMASKYDDNQVKQAVQTQIDIGASSGVNQGQLGDCWFESGLASVANSSYGRKLLADMVTQNKDGSYTVTFPGSLKTPVNVTEEDFKRFHLTNSAKWANVIEAAIIKLRPSSINFGGLSPDSLNVLTGKEAWGLQLTPKSDTKYMKNLGLFINNTLSLGQPIIADVSVRTNEGQFSHAFSVEKYDPKTGTIIVRNPWGANLAGNMIQIGNFKTPQVGQTLDGVTNHGNGVLTMPLSTFNDNFSDIAFLVPNKANMAILNILALPQK